MKMRFALVALLSVLAVVAQAQDTVLYGKFHASLDFVDNGGDGDDGTSSVNVSSNSSRFGIKGSEQIAPGLKGIFQVESSISFSSQDGSSLAGRNTFVGLQGGFGTVMFGRMDHPFKNASRKTDLFKDQIGDSRNILRRPVNTSGLGTPLVNDWDERTPDILAYVTPKFSGFQATLAYRPDEEDGQDATDVLSLNGIYKAKMFDIVAAYEQQGEAATQGGDVERATGFRFGGNVYFGAIRIAALYQQTSFDEADDSAYGLGASYKFGSNLVKAQFYATDNEGDDTNAQMFALGFERKLSKRTTAYAVYAQTTNDDFAAYDPVENGGGHGRVGIDAVDGETFSGFSLGVIHKF